MKTKAIVLSLVRLTFFFGPSPVMAPIAITDFTSDEDSAVSTPRVGQPPVPASASSSVAASAVAAASASSVVASEVAVASATASAEIVPVKHGRGLKRRRSDCRPDEPRAVAMHCIWGGSVKKPIAVYPLVKKGEQTWARVSANCPWLRQALSGQDESSRWSKSLVVAVAALREAIWEQLQSQADPVSAEAKRLCQDLGLSGSEDAAPGKPRRKVRKVAVAREGIVKLEGEAVQVLISKTLWVVADASSINAVIASCGRYLRKSLAEDAPPRAAFSVDRDGCTAYVGKVSWDTAKELWRVHYKVLASTTGKSKKKVTRILDFALGALSEYVPKPEAWAAARKQAYIQAVKCWNEEDASTSERIALSAD